MSRLTPPSSGKSNGSQAAPPDDPRRTNGEEPTLEMRPGTREWWENHWTEALNALKRYLEQGET